MNYHSIELFAGAGGLALGLESAGFNNILMNDFDKDCVNTLKLNRKEWNVIQGDIKNLDLSSYLGKVDLLTGGFSCQPFSTSGKSLGLDDIRGTVCYEMARCIKDCQPKVFMAENVKGLLSHDNGKTIKIIYEVFEKMGYILNPPLLLNTNNYAVAQKRERVIIIGVRKDLSEKFKFEIPSKSFVSIHTMNLNIEKNKDLKFKNPTLKDIMFAGNYYPVDIIHHPNYDTKGMNYSAEKISYFNYIKPGGCWINLPKELQEKYMGKMYKSGGGKRGVLRRLSWNEPCLTILCSPSQKQTERCHPQEIRPFNIRESARIQSFPDNWVFSGSISSQYRQIGNAVPVNFAYHIGCAIKKSLDNLLVKK